MPLSNSLARYGYLPDSLGSTVDMPIGFTVANSSDGPSFEITFFSLTQTADRYQWYWPWIDGRSAIVVVPILLQDLIDAVQEVPATCKAFASFASAAANETLRVDLKTWNLRFGTPADRSLLDSTSRGVGVDAVSMMFNRLTGFRVGDPPAHPIPHNIARADAPTRHPFLWSAVIQHKSQWPSCAEGGGDILGLSRKPGDIIGLLDEFRPVEQSAPFLLNRDYLENNSANVSGLSTLNEPVWKIGPLQWPRELDHGRTMQGAETSSPWIDDGGHTNCHGIRPARLVPYSIKLGTLQSPTSVLTQENATFSPVPF